MQISTVKKYEDGVHGQVETVIIKAVRSVDHKNLEKFEQILDSIGIPEILRIVERSKRHARQT